MIHEGEATKVESFAWQPKAVKREMTMVPPVHGMAVVYACTGVYAWRCKDLLHIYSTYSYIYIYIYTFVCEERTRNGAIREAGVPVPFGSCVNTGGEEEWETGR